MSLQRSDGKVFDGIVYAEVAPRTWLTGSDKHARTVPFGGGEDMEADKRPVRIIMVYKADGTTIAYRDGKPYGKAINRGRVEYKKGEAYRYFPYMNDPFLGVKVTVEAFRRVGKKLSKQICN